MWMGLILSSWNNKKSIRIWGELYSDVHEELDRLRTEQRMEFLGALLSFSTYFVFISQS